MDGKLPQTAAGAQAARAGGRVLRMRALRDMVKRRLAKVVVRLSGEQFHCAIQHSGIGMAIVAPDGRWLEVNPAFCAIVGYTRKEMLDMDFQSITHPDDLEADLQCLRRMLRREIATCQMEKRYLHKQGHAIWIQLNVALVWKADGRPSYFVTQVQDITERKRAEEQIREQASLLDLAPDAIMVRDLEDRVQYWNKSAERIYGWTATEAVGRKIEDLLHKDIFSISQCQKARKAVMEKGDWQGEFVTWAKTGEEVIIKARWTLVRDSRGNPKSILGINTDITERKKLETQFLRSQRMEGIGALAGGIAHDLNNVLTPLLVAVQVLREKVTDADGKKLLEGLEANVQRGAGLVKQVLSFGRGVEGERVPVNPKHIAREIKQIVHETFPKSVEYEFHSAPDLWTVTGDPTQLHQVLLNLYVNARDAMPNGGKLSLRMENVTFDEVYAGMNPEAKAGPYVLITVKDTGTGIPKEIQNKIFDPFFTTKEPGTGTGLGLSTTLAIVKSHGGFIHCHSAPGRGATFEVYLPANPPTTPAAEKAAVEPSRLPCGHNELVLVVDDEESIRSLAQRTLEHFGYRVLLAADGAEAVCLYAPRQKEIDAVITDMIMPVMDGLATIAALKAINSDVKIVSSSGRASEGGMAKARNAGIQHFIPKPYTAETMLKTLHEALGTGRAK